MPEPTQGIHGVDWLWRLAIECAFCESQAYPNNDSQRWTPVTLSFPLISNRVSSMTQFFMSPSEAETAFYNAFRQLDIEAMQIAWANQSAVYCIHPSGLLCVGREAVIQSWSELFQGVEKPRIDFSLINGSRYAEQAVHLVEERIGARSLPQESFSTVLATNVYILTDKGWHLFSHHATPSPTGLKPSNSPIQMH